MGSDVLNQKETVQHDDLDLEIADLKEEIAELKGRLRELQQKKRAAERKNLRREEIAALLLKECPHGMDVAQLARKVEERYVNQGRKAAPKKSDQAAKHMVLLGVLLGVLEVQNGKVAWKR